MKTTKRKPSLILRSLILGLVGLSAFGCTGLSRIEVDTELNFPEMGGRRPMAHHALYLLRNSIASPEMEEAFKKHMASTTPLAAKPGIPLKESEIRTRAGFMISDGRPIWHKYIIEIVDTDFQGKAVFRRMEPGDYWIYCIRKRPGGQWLLWNVKVTVNFYDTTKVTISNENISFN